MHVEQRGGVVSCPLLDRCDSCGSDVPSGAPVCPTCGWSGMTAVDLIRAAHNGQVQDLPGFGYYIGDTVPDTGTFLQLAKLTDDGLLVREVPGEEGCLLRPTAAGLAAIG